MATAIATVTIDPYPSGIDNSQRVIYVTGTIAIQASPATYATGGLALSFSAALQAATGFAIESLSGTPTQVWIDSVGGSLYDYGWNKAANKIQIFADSGGAAGAAPFAELGAVAIPASVSSDTIMFQAIFSRNM